MRDRQFLEMARVASEESIDPRTKVGCLIVKDGLILGNGCNRFPGGVKINDRMNNKNLKNMMINHAELDAISRCADKNEIAGSTFYIWQMSPCSRCAAFLIAMGVKRVVSLGVNKSNWLERCEVALLMFSEAGVKYDELEV